MGFPAKRRQWYLFDPKSKEPFTVSRTKIELFTQCPRCFYMDARLGVGRPKGPPFALNSAVDTLLKKEFDIHRARKTSHPLMKAYGIDAVPLDHKRMDEWRDSLKRGVSYLHKLTNLFVRGGIDDVWINSKGELIVVDYKATSKEGQITLDDEWKVQYKRQMEIYQWLFRKNDFAVSDTGYFIYVNGKTDRKSFDGKLEFDVAVIPYKGTDTWIEKTLVEMRACLMDTEIPKGSSDCEFCTYVDLVQSVVQSQPVSPTKTEPKPSKVTKTVKKLVTKGDSAKANQNLF